MRLTTIADLQQPGVTALEQQAMQLSRLYDDFLANYPDDSHTRDVGIHASELVVCRRQVVYSLFDTEKKGATPVEMRKRFNIGHAIHSMVQKDLGKMAEISTGRMTFDDEVKVNETPLAQSLCITSSCDGIFTFFDQENSPLLRVGLEVKSASPDDYDRIKKPKDQHIEQAHVYMACLDLPLMWFLYWNKGNQNYTPSVTPFLIRFNPAIWTRLEKRARECLEMAEKEQLPEREEGQHCRWCKFTWTCAPSTVQQPRYGRRPLPILGRK